MSLRSQLTQLAEQYLKDIDAVLKANHSEYHSGLANEFAIQEIWGQIYRVLKSEHAARELFTKWGRLPKRQTNEIGKRELAFQYALHGKPNARGNKHNGSSGIGTSRVRSA